MRTIASLLSPEIPTISRREPPRHQLFPDAKRREIVGVEGENKLAIVLIASK
jgi:hypothetical protein